MIRLLQLPYLLLIGIFLRPANRLFSGNGSEFGSSEDIVGAVRQLSHMHRLGTVLRLVRRAIAWRFRADEAVLLRVYEAEVFGVGLGDLCRV